MHGKIKKQFKYDLSLLTGQAKAQQQRQTKMEKKQSVRSF